MTKEQFLRGLPDNVANDDFYELCKFMMDLALDSEKVRLENGRVGARFSPEKMSKASMIVGAYMKKYNMDEDALIKAINLYAHNAIDDNDDRQKAYFDQTQTDAHVSGVLYLFTDIPDGILRKIFEDAKDK